MKKKILGAILAISTVITALTGCREKITDDVTGQEFDKIVLIS